MAIMAKSNAKLAAERVALYGKLIATNPRIERKGDANPYTSVIGNMFTLLHESRLAIRLPEAEREKFLKKYKTGLMRPTGTSRRNTLPFRTTSSRKPKS